MPARQVLHRAAEDDPDVGFFKRKAMRLRRLGIVAIGPSAPPAPAPAPLHADRVRLARKESDADREHSIVVKLEIVEIDKHRTAIERRLASLPAGASFERQELQAELRQLAVLRVEISADLDKPIRTDRDGRPLSDQMIAFLRVRAAELREQSWWGAERAEREGDHRRARRLRHDGLRSRHLALHEAGVIKSLRGYSFPG